MFIMLPVFALCMNLLYFRKKTSYTEHLIFIFHTQTIFFILLFFATILNRLFNSSITPVFLLIFLVYLFIALRKVYKQNKWKTFSKFTLLNIAYILLTVVGLFITMVLAVFI